MKVLVRTGAPPWEQPHFIWEQQRPQREADERAAEERRRIREQQVATFSPGRSRNPLVSSGKIYGSDSKKKTKRIELKRKKKGKREGREKGKKKKREAQEEKKRITARQCRRRITRG